MNRIMLFLGLVLIAHTRLLAQDGPVTQSTLNMGGGSAQVRFNFDFDWSIGESTIIDTYSGENSYGNSIVGKIWYFTAGVLQPFDKTHIIYNPLIATWTNQEIRFYPVPTPDIIFIDFHPSPQTYPSNYLAVTENYLASKISGK